MYSDNKIILDWSYIRRCCLIHDSERSVIKVEHEVRLDGK